MLINVVYPPSCPIDGPAAPRTTRSCISASFHDGRISALLKDLAARSIRAPLRFCFTYFVCVLCGVHLQRHLWKRCRLSCDPAAQLHLVFSLPVHAQCDMCCGSCPCSPNAGHPERCAARGAGLSARSLGWGGRAALRVHTWRAPSAFYPWQGPS